MHVKDYMQTRIVTVRPTDPVSMAFVRMRGNSIRHLPVVTEQQHLVGIVTERDIRQAGASDAPHMAEHELIYLLEKLAVQDIMTTRVVTVSHDTPLTDTGQILLEKKLSGLPVVHDDQTLEGLITVTDLLQAYVAQQSTEGRIRVDTVMQTQIVTATPEMSLARVQRLMRDQHIRHVPVVSAAHLVGMITDRDIRDASPSPATTLSRGEIAYHMDTTPVKACMTRDLVWIGPDIDMADATRLLLQHRFGCLPVVANGALVGVITETDCLRAFLRTLQPQHTP